MPDQPSTLGQTDRTTLRRKRERGSYDRTAANAVLDEALVAHVGFEVDGWPAVVPMAHARVGELLYLHGATGNRMLRRLAEGARVCVTVTLVDGIVLARSAVHHSVNFRSVVLYGTAERVTDPDEVDRAAAALLDHMAPGRSADARPPSQADRRQTLFVRVRIDEGSLKVRTGGPIDEPEDMALPVWAGVVPLSVAAGPAEPDPALAPDVALPAYVAPYPPRGRSGA